MAKDLKFSALLDIYGGVLTEKQKDMLELYYNEDLSLSEIAEQAGISRQGVRDSIKRGEETLSELEEKIGVAAIYEKYDAILDGVIKAADGIIADCRSYTTTKNVIEKLERMKNAVSSGRN